ncbi:MAG: hypothetical protein IRZ28_17890 [Steroidobacteraceae bacterium]|nr:hypothetical protein [Steroidobacteraceae bacterium]
MNRSLPLLAAATCLAAGCATAPERSETQALAHDILNKPRLVCPEGEIPYCVTTASRIARAKHVTDCGCGPQTPEYVFR